jgi:putative transcriptional regulator
VDSYKGQLLVASPQLLDPNFVRTVLLMIEHNDEGAAGIVLNRPSGRTIAEVAASVFDEELDWEKPIHLGGPVPGPVLVLHQVEDLADSVLGPGLFSTVDSDKLLEILRREPEPSLVLANYAGWGPGQLEREMQEDAWKTFPAAPEHVFWNGEDELWDVVHRVIGQATLAEILGRNDIPADPSLN